MSKTDALLDGNKTAPSPSDISVMVRLAKNKMVSDFKKTLDNDAPHNYELENGLFDPSDAVGAFNDFVQGVTSGDSTSCFNKSVKDCATSAVNSGLLVGEVPGGEYGVWQFSQFYPILKTKKEMDKRKAMMDQARNVRKSGMGRLYGQLGAIGEGIGATLNGIGEFVGAGVQGIINIVKSAGEDGLKAYGSYMIGDYKGVEKYGKSTFQKADKEAAKSEKQMSQALEKSVQGLIYAMSGIVDIVLLGVEIATDSVLSILTLGSLNNQNTGLTGKYNEG
ncbi:toxin HINT domain protein, partial [Leptospira ellisii]|nr:toxin HINT domain protein [Leptospira ellisii]